MAYGEYNGGGSSGGSSGSSRAINESATALPLLSTGAIIENSFQYTDGGEFTFQEVDILNRLIVQDYIGYYHYMNGTIMSDRVHSTGSIILSARRNVSSDYIVNRFELDRTISDKLGLPYQENELHFQPNEFLNQNTINLKLKMLYDNFLTLYDYGFVANNSFAPFYTGYIGLTGATNSNKISATRGTDPRFTQLSYVTETADDGGGNVGLSMNYGTLSSAGMQLSAANGFEIIGMESSIKNPLLKKTPEDVFLCFFSPSALNMYTFQNSGEDSTVNFVLSTDRAGGQFSQEFQSITDITSNQFDTLYVADSYHNQVYRLYIDPILNVSRINAANYDLINSGGLKLNTIGNTYLSGGTNIYFSEEDNELYIYNDGGGNVLVTDENLLFKRQYSTNLLSGGNVADFAVNEIDQKIYFLLEDFSILTVRKDFTGDTGRIFLANKIRGGEEPRRIIFSQNDSNVYYVATSKNLYKYFIDYRNPQDGYIGDYDWANTPVNRSDGTATVAFTGTDQIINDIKILADNETHDSLFIFDKNNTNNGFSRLLRFNDSNTSKTIFNDTKFKIFNFNDIKVDTEFFNNITFNKSIKKIIYNLDNLSENISGSFKYRFDSEQVPRFTTVLTLSSPFTYNFDYNNFVGVNEVVTPQVFNRVFDYILNYQRAILSELESIAENTKFPPEQIIQI